MSDGNPDLACRRVADIVTEYLEGELAPAQRAQLEQHLLICQACAQFVAQHKSTIGGLGALAHKPPTTSARDAALAAFRKLRGGTP